MLILFSILGVATELRDLRRSRNFRQMCVRARVCVCVCGGGGGGGGEGRGGGGSRSNGQKTSDLVVTCVFFVVF